MLHGEWTLGIAALVAGALLLWWYLDRWWPDAQWRAVLRGPMPYDLEPEARAAALGTLSSSPASTSAS